MKNNPKSDQRASKAAFAVLIVLFCFTNLFAQGDAATLRGTVVDETGAIIAGAKVTVSNVAKAIKRDVVSNADGFFTVPLLPPETYEVTVEQTGFGSVKLTDVKLNANDQRQLRVELKPSKLFAELRVEADTQGVETGGATATTVGGQLVERLPLNGRSFQSLLYQVPGVVPAAGSGQISVNGNRTDSNYFTLDGVSANIGVAPRSATAASALGVPYGVSGAADQTSAGSTGGFNASGSTAGLISVDSLQEFKVQTSAYSAEFGRQVGGQIQLTSKSGENDFHFTAFEYFRNEALDANDWFTNRSGLPRPPLRQNDFGGTFSGPLYLPRFGEGGPALYNGKKRTFFFASFEALKLKQPLPGIIQNVPAQYVRDSAALFNPTIRSILNAFPLPNGGTIACAAGTLPAGFVNPCPTGQIPTTQFQTFTKNNFTLQNTTAFSLRIDHKLYDKWNAFGRVSISPSDSQSPTVGRIAINEVNTKTLTLGLSGVFSANLVNDFRFNWSGNEGNSFTNPSTLDGVNPPSARSLLPNIAPQDSFVSVSLPGTNINYQTGFGTANRQRQLNFVDNLTVIKGNHNIKFGADYRQLNPEYAPREYQATVSITTLANLVAGLGTATIAASDQVPLRIQNYSIYAQDSWRASKRLTLDFGVRWDINPAPTGTDKPLYSLTGLGDLTQLGRLNAPPSTIQLTTGKLYPTKYDAFAPRFGFAYNLRGKAGWETVVRGGIGLYYDLGAGISANAGSQFPYSRSISAGTVAFPLTDITGAPPAPISVTPPIAANQEFTVIDPDFSLPRSYQWTATVSQNFWGNYFLSVSYVGNQGRGLLRRYLTQLSTSATVNPNFTSARINVTTNKAGNADSSDYHAMQVQFNRRFAKGWQFLSNYSWSHAIDTGSDNTSFAYFATNSISQNDRGNSDFDRRHVFNMALSYETKLNLDSKLAKAFINGWTTDVIFKAQSAAPFSVTYQHSIPSFGTAGALFPFRANVVAGQDPWITDPTAPGGKRLNPAAFVTGASVFPTVASLDNTTQGNSLRNGYYGFGATQLDLAMGRNFSLTEKLKLSLKGEVFNILNHPNFANPSPSLGNYTAGTTTVSYSPSDPCLTNPTTACTTFGRSTRSLNRSFGTTGFSALYQLGGPRSVQLSAKFIF